MTGSLLRAYKGLGSEAKDAVPSEVCPPHLKGRRSVPRMTAPRALLRDRDRESEP